MDSKTYKKFFNKKKILITGNTGFVGSYLSIVLSLFGANILGYSLRKKIKDIYQIIKFIKNQSKLFTMIF